MFSGQFNRNILERMLLGTIAVAALTACGGGGGGGEHVPDADDDPTWVDTLVISDLRLGYHDTDVRIDLDCHGDTCTASFQGESLTFDFDDLLETAPGDPGGLRRTGTRNGVPLGEGSDTQSADGDRMRIDVYGGWLDASAFGIGIARMESGDFSGLEMGYGMSIGNAPDTNPRAADGGATWRGAVLAVDTRSFDNLEGEVTLDIDSFANPGVHVEITGLAGRPAITWADVPLRAGSFVTGGGGNSVNGRFYGDTHQEAGGVFERDHIVGAFGARRDSQ